MVNTEVSKMESQSAEDRQVPLSTQSIHEQLMERRDCPRNWPQWWRIIILINISLYNLIGNVFVNGLSSVQANIAADMKISFTDAGRLATWAERNLWGVAASRVIGRRYTILASLIAFLACNVWFGVAKTYGSAVGSRVVGGLFGGIVESIGPAMIEEVFAPRELARALVVYTCSLAAGSSLGPVLSGYIATGTGDWRWFCWILAICCGFLLVSCTLMLPETSFPVTSDELSLILRDLKDGETIEHGSELVVDEVDEKSNAAGRVNIISTLAVGYKPSWSEIWWRNSFFRHHAYIHRPASWAKLLLDPIRLLAVPSILATTIIFGMSIGWSIVSGINFSMHFSQPPLSWKASSIGLITLAALIGLILGSITGGPLADWLMNRPIKNSDAEGAEPLEVGAFGGSGHRLERRLLVAVIPAIIYPAGFLIVGETITNYSPWISTAIGVGISGWGITAACNPFITYCIDCYPAYAGQIAITISVFKNCLAYGCAFGTVAWINSTGQIQAYGMMTGLLYAMMLFMIPIYIWGKPIRVWTYTWL